MVDGITDATDISLGKLQEMVRDREAYSAAVHGSQGIIHTWVTEKQQFSPTVTYKLFQYSEYSKVIISALPGLSLLVVFSIS